MGEFIDFDDVKRSITLKVLIKGYGFEVKRNNELCCPFHNEKTPSFHIYEDHYHCFGCGEHGDAITFVQKLFNLERKDAAIKINSDFGLGLSTTVNRSPQEIKQIKSEILEKQQQLSFQEKIVHNVEVNISKYIRALNQFKFEYAPKNPYDTVDLRFVEALQKLDEMMYISEKFSECRTINEKLEFMNSVSESIAYVNKRVSQISADTNKSSVQKKIDANIRKIKQSAKIDHSFEKSAKIKPDKEIG